MEVKFKTCQGIEKYNATEMTKNGLDLIRQQEQEKRHYQYNYKAKINSILQK